MTNDGPRLSGRVLITGGAGYLARGIYRRAERERWDAEFVCISRDDAKHAHLQARWPQIQTHLVDVSTVHPDDLTRLFLGFDTVIHAAASKYVDRSEHEAFATMRHNILGSESVALAALRARVPRALCISTDKACHPTNMYGASKFVMERMWQEAARDAPATEFVGVRYGNVVGSTGSVIPMFERQLAEEGRLRLTDPEMTRFWMSIEEAVDTILYALHHGPNGTIAIPSMRAMRLHDLALMTLGFDEHRELPPEMVDITGIRPGEKRHESIIHRQESLRVTPPQGFGGYYLLGDPSSAPVGDEAFEVTSAEPPRGMISPKEMRELVQDAKVI